jgi:hypothetical protein
MMASDTRRALLWAQEDKLPKHEKTFTAAIDAERHARFEEWDHSTYLVWPDAYFHHSGFGSYACIKKWHITAPHKEEEKCVLDPKPLKIVEAGNYAQSAQCPVFELEEIAQDFACSLDLGRHHRMRIAGSAHPFYEQRDFSHVGLIDAWLTKYFQSLGAMY